MEARKTRMMASGGEDDGETGKVQMTADEVG
jgi:hypothetical protein